MQTAFIITPARLLTEKEMAKLRARCRLEAVSPAFLVSSIVRRALAAGSKAGTTEPAP